MRRLFSPQRTHILHPLAKTAGDGVLRLWWVAFFLLPLLHNVEHYQESRRRLVSPFAALAHHHEQGKEHTHSHSSPSSQNPAEHGKYSIEHQQSVVLPGLWWWERLSSPWESSPPQRTTSLFFPQLRYRLRRARAPPQVSTRLLVS